MYRSVHIYIYNYITPVRRYVDHSAEDTEGHPEVVAAAAYLNFRQSYNCMAAWALEQQRLRYPLRPKIHMLEHVLLGCI